MDKPLYDRAMFWVAVAGVVAVAGFGVLGFAALETIPEHLPLTESVWIVPGVALVILALVALMWAVLLAMAHNHARSHIEGAIKAQSGKKGAAKVAPYRLAADTLIAWLYRRKEWHGLSVDGKYREPAPNYVGVEMYRVLQLPGPYEPVENIAPEPGFDGPGTFAHAEVAEGSGATHSSSVMMTDSVATRVIPGPDSPTLDQVSYQSSGRRHFAYGEFKRRPKAVRFSKPEDRLLRSADLPFEISCSTGRIVVEKFYSDGVVIDEDGTVGDPIAFVAYFDD